LYCAPQSHEIINGITRAAKQHGIKLKKISREEREKLYPSFRPAADDETWLEPDAGFLLPEGSIALFVSEAVKIGATIKTGEKVISWKKEGKELTVTTTKGIYSCRKLIITAGAWAPLLTQSIHLPLTVTRQVIVWVKPDQPDNFLPENFPCWMRGSSEIKGAYYGFPFLAGDAFPGPAGLKFALHFPAGKADPDNVKREVGSEEVRTIIQGINEFFPALDGSVVATKTCLYTNTLDENFIIDHLPGFDEKVIIAAGFSGHGFKFVPVVGEILADLAITGKTELPIGFLSLERFTK
jgi:sarcosine oxidase